MNLNFKLISDLLYIVMSLLSIIWVILAQSFSKSIVIDGLEERIKEFHSEYIEGNYQLRVMRLHELKSAKRAIRVINRNKEEYYMIPEEEIRWVNFCVWILNNYTEITTFLIKTIKILIVVVVAIGVGLNL